MSLNRAEPWAILIDEIQMYGEGLEPYERAMVESIARSAKRLDWRPDPSERRRIAVLHAKRVPKPRSYDED